MRKKVSKRQYLLSKSHPKFGKNKALSLLMAVAIVIAALPMGAFFVAAEHLDNDAPSMSEYSKDTPQRDYVISKKSEFISYLNRVAAGETFDGKVIHIMCDLDFSSGEYIDLDVKGYYEENIAIRAIIDGHGHTIKGLTGESMPKWSGLLGRKIQAGSVAHADYDGAYAGVFNLNLVDCNISTSNTYIGALFGSVEAGGKVIFKNVYSNTTISSSNKYVGGLIGYNMCDEVEIKGCAVDGTISSSFYSDDVGIGGLVGCNGASQTIEASLIILDSAFYGELTAADEAEGIGGFVGNNGRDGLAADMVALNISNSLCTALFAQAGECKGIAVGKNYTNAELECSNIYASDAIDNVEQCVGSNSEYTFISKPDSQLKGNDAIQISGFKRNEGYLLPCEVFRGAYTRFGGYQVAQGDTGYKNIRLIATLDDGLDGLTLEQISSVGFDIVMTAEGLDGKQWTNRTIDGEAPYIETVYSSVVADNKEIYANTYGGECIFLATVNGIKENVGNVSFTVKVFYEDMEGTRIYSSAYNFVYNTATEA